jgi:nicotinate-nucleotide adenylyltransferase
LANKKTGIYGGTFDPIHNGHLRVVVELISRKIVDQIILIPAGEPRLRQAAPIADGPTRLEMCNLAISDLPPGVKDKVTVSDIEILRNGPSYAIDTVEQLEKSGDELFWIIGSDAYANIDKWHRSEELQEKVSFIVVDRPGSDQADGNESLDIGALDISATEIRSDKEVNGTSPSVRKFITQRKLYASK